MVNLVRVAARDDVERRSCQRGFDLHHLRGARVCAIGGVAEQRRHLADVFDVLLAQLQRLGVVAEVVVAIGQAHAALVGNRHLDRRIFEVGLGTEAEEWLHADRVQLGDERRQRVRAGQRGNLLEQRFERRRALRVDRRFVHAGHVVVANLLRPRRRRAGSGCRFENLLQRLVVVLLQLVEPPPARSIRRYRVLRHPASTGVLVEIGTGVDRLVHRIELKARRRLGRWGWWGRSGRLGDRGGLRHQW